MDCLHCFRSADSPSHSPRSNFLEEHLEMTTTSASWSILASSSFLPMALTIRFSTSLLLDRSSASPISLKLTDARRLTRPTRAMSIILLRRASSDESSIAATALPLSAMNDRNSFTVPSRNSFRTAYMPLYSLLESSALTAGMSATSNWKRSGDTIYSLTTLAATCNPCASKSAAEYVLSALMRSLYDSRAAVFGLRVHDSSESAQATNSVR
mmetsp:Transcript_503/g.1337  ORF Transcript_503/g.1337 Transcript_503/m.1337 type:complete len:212 (+) Transcript_503:3263-3898(+)